MSIEKLAQAQRTALAACAITIIAAGTALAQAVGGDPLGASTIATAVTATIKVIAGIGVVYGFLRLMTGRHTIEGLTVIGVGALGVYRAEALGHVD